MNFLKKTIHSLLRLSKSLIQKEITLFLRQPLPVQVLLNFRLGVLKILCAGFELYGPMVR